jgi:hypothetical protein
MCYIVYIIYVAYLAAAEAGAEMRYSLANLRYGTGLLVLRLG